MGRASSASSIVIGTWSIVLRQGRSLGIGIVFFSMLIALVAGTAKRFVNRAEGLVMEATHLTVEQLYQRADTRLQGLQSSDIVAFVEHSRTLSSEESGYERMTSDEAIDVFLISLAPWILFSLLVDLLILLVASTYFLLVIEHPRLSTPHLLPRLPSTVLRMVFTLLWMIIRSLVWIPFVGPLIALHYGPRLCLAPVVVARGSSGTFSTARKSLHATSHRWTEVFPALLLFLLQLFILTFIGTVLLAPIALFSGKIAFLLWTMFFMLLVCLQMGFLSSLGRRFLPS
jgi:hypothetical protein